jgi:hypothetical protein
MCGGATWEPIEISQDDYDKIVAELRRVKKGAHPIEAPEGVEVMATGLDGS